MKELEVIWDGRNLLWAGDGKEFLRGVGLRYLKHPFFEEAYRKIIEEYEPPKKKLCLFIPCSYGKPYSQSFIHYFIQKAIVESGAYEQVHQVILTNAGVVPRELDEYYPFCAYDWNPQYETPEIKKLYTEVLAERLKGYLQKHGSRYEMLACYLRWDSDSYAAVRIVEKELGVSIPNLAPNNVPAEEVSEISLGIYEDPDLVLITRTSLEQLKNELRKLLGAEAKC